ncbi:NAD-dependent epimerase/dehydratase family protein [Emcibacter sp.]|uniref:NAD-dependent epimerase/dehydratase family protein n=1 Tax=Emcibacter sp. TaxID=1979954 RepID=UPI002AA641B3|nr:NAD-dependent epimerase/dehydratase family protein [Emcibacter sp.]
MRLAITGAAGFIGRAVADHIGANNFTGEVRLIDSNLNQIRNKQVPGFEYLEIDLIQKGALEKALEGVDRLLHLAALPGAAAEENPDLSQQVNLDLPLDMFARMNGRRLVYASSIAVYGNCFPDLVDDTTAPQPTSVYGTHKRMVELAFSDAIRRNVIKGVAVRLPGIVARPPSAEGFGSAFLSDIFHAVRAGENYVVPVAPEATSWLMSSKICALNLAHALLSDFTENDAITLSAVHTSLSQLACEAAKYGNADKITYKEDTNTRRLFGSHPPLNAQKSKILGFQDDVSVSTLVDNVMNGQSTGSQYK